MNAFTIPVKSLASYLAQPKILKRVDPNPRPTSFLIESGAQAAASALKTQLIVKGSMR